MIRPNDDEKPDAVYMVFIAAPPQAVWDLLTDKARSPDFFFGNTWTVGEAVGAPFKADRADGTPDVDGQVLIRDEPNRLRISWKLVWAPELPVAEFDFQIEAVGELTRLTLSQFNNGRVDKKFMTAGREGWSLILSSLKTLLETGKPLPKVAPRPPQ
jgi:uncharacterized protein YndB with AHSA1/START domain